MRYHLETNTSYNFKPNANSRISRVSIIISDNPLVVKVSQFLILQIVNPRNFAFCKTAFMIFGLKFPRTVSEFINHYWHAFLLTKYGRIQNVEF